MKILILSLLGIILSLVIILAWAGYPWSLQAKKITPEIVHVEPLEMRDVTDKPSVIKILTWNIGFLYGRGSEGPGYEYRDKEFFEGRLKEFAKSIKEWDADIICLQEIDFDSHRSNYLNQAQFLAIHAGYPYVAEAVSWDVNYIPFPYWPFSRNFGSMRSGGAVLSRYPIIGHEVDILKKPASNPWWYNIFYLHRYFQKVTLELGEKKFSLINLHLEAFDKKDRELQIRQLSEKIKQEKVDFVAGDFNMVPSSALKKTKFEGGDDYENDSSFDLMSKTELQESIPEEIYSKDEALYFTFPSWKPDRRLDYIFYRRGHKMMKAEILNSALSDHLPLRASFQIDSPNFNLYSQ